MNFQINFKITMIKKLLSVAVFTAVFSLSARSQTAIPADINALLQKHTCYTCHKADKKLVGPSWKEIAGKKYSAKKFTDLVYKPVAANFPQYTPPMVGLPNVPKGDLAKISTWVATLAN